MKAIVPSVACLIGFTLCFWLIQRSKYETVQYHVQITVYGPDGKVIPAIRHR